MLTPRTPHDLLFLASFILVPATLLMVTRSGLAERMVLAGSSITAIEQTISDDWEVSGGRITEAQKALNARRASIAAIAATLKGRMTGAAAFIGTVETAGTGKNASVKRIYGYETDTAKPLASITKLMTALVALEQTGHDQITISPVATATEGDGQIIEGETWSKSDLIQMALLGSSNDASEALAEAYGREDFIVLMNETALKYNLMSMKFYNPTGLDIDTEIAGAVGSAADVANLAAYVMTNYPFVFAITSETNHTFTSTAGRTITLNNTNPLNRELPGLFFSKTGFTDIAGGNLVVMFDTAPGKPYVAVTLGSTFDGRFSDIGAMNAAVVANPI